MHDYILSLAVFTAWTLFMVTGIVAFRSIVVLKGDKASNAFPADEDHGGPPYYRRAIRAHLNCVENLVIYAALILSAVLLKLPAGEYTWVLIAVPAARICQSVVHLLGITEHHVNVRFAFWIVQVAGFITLLVGVMDACAQKI